MVVDKLNFPIGSILKEILVFEDQDLGGDELALDQVFLIFSDCHIVLQPIVDTDEIDILVKPDKPEKTEVLSVIHSPKWSSVWIGQKLQTVWVCPNTQGYCDRISFAFQTLRPSLDFLCEGSILTVLQSQPILKTSNLLLQV